MISSPRGWGRAGLLEPSRRSGLVEVRSILKDVPGAAFLEFKEEDVMRHSLVKDILAAYDRAGG